MNLTMIALGTRGDVQPAVALGKALRERGHAVRLLASRNFHDWIAGHGLETAEATVDIQQIMAGEGGAAWVERGHNPLAQTRVMKGLLDASGWQMVQDAWRACQGADLIFSSFTSDAYVTAIAEKLGVPQVSMLLQPPTFASREGHAVLNAPLPGRRSLINYGFGKVFIEPFSWQILGELTTRLRRELGLPPQSGRANLAVRRGLLTLLGYSPLVVPPPADWPSGVHTTGYWFLDEEPGWEPPGPLRAFLEAGPPPVYIGFGSMTGRDPARITRWILEAVARAGARAVVASGWAGLGAGAGGASAGGELPADVFRLDAAPHDRLFPLMAAVVHHGGAGTTAAGLRAGVPTVVVPHMVDQPFWGRRVAALGVGPPPLPRRKLTAERLAARIAAATTDATMQARAAALGAAIRAEDGLGRALEVLEREVGM